MHELPVIQSILDIVIKHAEMNDVSKVIKIYLKVGVLSDLEDQWMQQYFDYVAKESVAEGATLEIERVPARMKCNACSFEFEPDMKKDEKIVCPACGNERCNLIAGKNYSVANMEVL
jgi:hydrogenase nickel incorporation protein HypA/HybF